MKKNYRPISKNYKKNIKQKFIINVFLLKSQKLNKKYNYNLFQLIYNIKRFKGTKQKQR